MMELKFKFDGIDGTARLKCTTPNKYGNICAEITWGGLVMRPTFRSVKDFITFVEDSDRIARLIEETAHCHVE